MVVLDWENMYILQIVELLFHDFLRLDVTSSASVYRRGILFIWVSGDSQSCHVGNPEVPGPVRVLVLTSSARSIFPIW